MFLVICKETEIVLYLKEKSMIFSVNGNLIPTENHLSSKEAVKSERQNPSNICGSKLSDLAEINFVRDEKYRNHFDGFSIASDRSNQRILFRKDTHLL